MKVLVYFIGLCAVMMSVVWFVSGMTPKNQGLWLLGRFRATTGSISEHISETADSAKKLKGVLTERYAEAADVYHGQDPNEPQYRQMDEMSK